jgi:AcrR family transcriptional regulator
MRNVRRAGKIGRPTAVPGEQHTRQKILSAAIELFAAQGYDGTSVRRIAEDVGITESAVYRHYASKEAILEAILAYAESRIYSPLPIERSLGEGGGESVFSGLLKPLPRIILSDPAIVKITRIIFAEMHHDAGIRRYYQSEFVDRADEYMEAFFRKCIEKGRIRACDPRALARVFNAFRAEWTFQTFIVEKEGALDLDSIEKDLQSQIDLFELLLDSEGATQERR